MTIFIREHKHILYLLNSLPEVIKYETKMVNEKKNKFKKYFLYIFNIEVLFKGLLSMRV